MEAIILLSEICIFWLAAVIPDTVWPEIATIYAMLVVVTLILGVASYESILRWCVQNESPPLPYPVRWVGALIVFAGAYQQGALILLPIVLSHLFTELLARNYQDIKCPRK